MGNSDQLGDEDASKTAAPLENVIEPVVSPPAPDKDAVGKLAGTRTTDPDPSAPEGAGQASPGTGKPHPAVSPEQPATAPDPDRDDVASASASPTEPDTGSARKLSTQPLQDPPELIRKRYLRSGNQYRLFLLIDRMRARESLSDSLVTPPLEEKEAREGIRLLLRAALTDASQLHITISSAAIARGA